MFRYLHRAAVARTYAHVVTQTFSRRLTDVSNITNPVKMSGGEYHLVDLAVVSSAYHLCGRAI